jgi:hypothetical protein
MTLAKNERSEVRSASGIVPEAKRSGIVGYYADPYNIPNEKTGNRLIIV